jgi:hypothetical protein
VMEVHRPARQPHRRLDTLAVKPGSKIEIHGPAPSVSRVREPVGIILAPPLTVIQRQFTTIRSSELAAPRAPRATSSLRCESRWPPATAT